MYSVDLNNAVWSKSSKSSNGDCVEVAHLAGERIGVRDSKDTKGPILVFTAKEWRMFLGGVKMGEFNL
jgi:Domain of unknown function (DUF397).